MTLVAQIAGALVRSLMSSPNGSLNRTSNVWRMLTPGFRRRSWLRLVAQCSKNSSLMEWPRSLKYLTSTLRSRNIAKMSFADVETGVVMTK